jgi:hypothetical protein
MSDQQQGEGRIMKHTSEAVPPAAPRGDRDCLALTGSRQAEGPPAADAEAGERLTFILLPKVADDLDRLQERTKLSRTDLTNRAITLYEFFDAQLRSGQDMLARDSRTRELKRIQLLDGSQDGPAPQSGPPAQGSCPAHDQRHPGRHRRRVRHVARTASYGAGQASPART